MTKGYKAFKPGLICEPDGRRSRTHYEEGKEFKWDGAPVLCDTWYTLRKGEFVKYE